LVLLKTKYLILFYSGKINWIKIGNKKPSSSAASQCAVDEEEKGKAVWIGTVIHMNDDDECNERKSFYFILFCLINPVMIGRMRQTTVIGRNKLPKPFPHSKAIDMNSNKMRAKRT